MGTILDVKGLCGLTPEALLAMNWWAAAIRGVSAIVLAIRGARKHQRWGWLALNGVVSLIVAAAALFYPFITILVLIALFAAWALITGALSIAAAMKLPKNHGRGWLIAGGVIAIICGLAMVLLPTLGMVTLTFLVGFQALFAGMTLLGLAFRLRARSLEVAPAVVAARDDAPVAPEAEARPV